VVKAILNREELGDWEKDLVKGSKQKGNRLFNPRGALILKVPSVEVVHTLLSEHGLLMFKSITLDNGFEFR